MVGAADRELPLMTERKDGFTLVELSIVLVIMGLLIGGILVAQSMISTSKITATIQQIGQFDAGVENFKTKYNYLPGDAPAFGGDGNGVISGVGTTGGYYLNVAGFDCEIAAFWNNIDPQNYPGASVCDDVGVQANTTGPNKNVPLSKLGSPNAFFIASAMPDNSTNRSADPASQRNYYAILDGAQAQTADYIFQSTCPTCSGRSSVKPADLLALDKKIDDGIGNTGNVLSGSMKFNISLGAISLDSAYNCSDISSGAYNVSVTTYECTPLIRIGAQTGDPQ
jgi:prepilin-type N-terminal cleavage/methylation domain-containing protein